MDKGQAIPVILKKKVEETGPLQVNIGKDTIHRQYNREEHVSLDRIFEDSESKFYMAGKNTKIGLLNFLQLFDKHDTNEILDLEKEDIVISSELITRIATAPVVDEDQEDMKYIDAVAIGIFCSSLFLSLFILMSAELAEIKTFSLILVIVSLVFLGNYTYRGIKSGQLMKAARICIKSLSKK